MSLKPLGKRKLKKALFASFLAVLLAVSTTAGGVVLGISGKKAHAESLAEITVLKDVNVKAELGNVDGKGDYTLALKLTGNNVADVELLNPDKQIVFYAKELADKWSTKGTDGLADVKVSLTAITLDDLPALKDLVDQILGLLEPVGGLVAEVEKLVNNIGLLKVEGLTEVTAALDNLKNLTISLDKLLKYDEDIKVEILENGAVLIEFNDGLGQRIQSLVNDTVLPLVNDLLTAVGKLSVQLDTTLLNQVIDILNVELNQDSLLGSLLSSVLGLVNQTLKQLIDTVGNTVNELLQAVTGAEGALNQIVGLVKDLVVGLVDPVTQTVVGLLDDLANLNVLGSTEVTLDLTIKKPTGLNQEVKVYGAAIQESAITLNLLSSLIDYDTIVFNEKADTPPAEEPKDPEPEKPKEPEKPGIKLPDTATAAGAIGLTGLAALGAGLAARFVSRRK